MGLGLWWAISFLTSAYYALYLSLFLLIGLVVLPARVRLREVWRRLALSGVLAAAVVLPTAGVQWSALREYGRSDRTIQRTSAEAVDYVRLLRDLWG